MTLDFSSQLLNSLHNKGEEFLNAIAPEINSVGLTSKWFLADFNSAVALVAAYLLFVLIGSIVMGSIGLDKKGKSPFEGIIGVQPFYNLVQVMACSYMMIRAIEQYFRDDYNLVCNAFDPKDEKMAYVLHLFYLSKVLDFWDTVVIIFRQKWDQLSFLHVYHHSSIFFVYWMNTRIGYTGDIYFTIVLNCFVHIVMYTYYMFKSLEPAWNPWWKKHITNLQMVQFLCMNAQAIYLLTNGCQFPKYVTMFYLVYIISLFALFYHFSVQAYGKNRKTKGGNKAEEKKLE